MQYTELRWRVNGNATTDKKSRQKESANKGTVFRL